MQSDLSRVKVVGYRDTTEEDNLCSSSDICSEYNPYLEMSGRGTEMIEERRKKTSLDREAQLLSQRSKARKSTVSGADKGKGVSSMTIVKALPAQPVAKTTPIKGKVSRSPASYDVEKLARWKPPLDVDESVRAELGKLPMLPTPRGCSTFGMLGTGPKFSHHVMAPYMSFTGDKVKLTSQSSSDIFNSMLESTTDIMEKLPFSAQAMAEREAILEKIATKSRNEVERLQKLMNSFYVERERAIS